MSQMVSISLAFYSVTDRQTHSRSIICARIASRGERTKWIADTQVIRPQAISRSHKCRPLTIPTLLNHATRCGRLRDKTTSYITAVSCCSCEALPCQLGEHWDLSSQYILYRCCYSTVVADCRRAEQTHGAANSGVIRLIIFAMPTYVSTLFERAPEIKTI